MFGIINNILGGNPNKAQESFLANQRMIEQMRLAEEARKKEEAELKAAQTVVQNFKSAPPSASANPQQRQNLDAVRAAMDKVNAKNLQGSPVQVPRLAMPAPPPMSYPAPVSAANTISQWSGSQPSMMERRVPAAAAGTQAPMTMSQLDAARLQSGQLGALPPTDWRSIRR